MRIISLAPSNTEILYAIGAGTMIVANTMYCDFPPESKRLPKVGSWIRIDPKKLQPLQPDLIITSSIVQAQFADTLKKAGLPVLHLDPRTLNDIYESILHIGAAVGKASTAQRVVAHMKEHEHAIRISSPRTRIKVYIEEWFNPPMISGNWVPDIVALAGYRYGILDAGAPSRAVTLDEVRAYDPDIILSSYCGFGKQSNPNHLLHRPGWNTLRAVVEKRLYNLDETILNRPGPRILQAVADIQYAISTS